MDWDGGYKGRVCEEGAEGGAVAGGAGLASGARGECSADPCEGAGAGVPRGFRQVPHPCHQPGAGDVSAGALQAHHHGPGDGLYRVGEPDGSSAGHEERGAAQFRGGHSDHGSGAGVPRHPAFRLRVDGPTLRRLRPQAVLRRPNCVVREECTNEIQRA